MRKWPWQKFAVPMELDADLEACFGKDFVCCLKDDGFACRRIVSSIIGNQIEWERVAESLKKMDEHYNSRYYYWYIFNLNLKHAPQFTLNI